MKLFEMLKKLNHRLWFIAFIASNFYPTKKSIESVSLKAQ